jgi:predicted alpha/beta-fold hydrolase
MEFINKVIEAVFVVFWGRVFSAADSDDVRLAVKFVANSRNWATILGVGWGLGANALTTYLGKEGSYTPLTAAVCIDNPFDLTSVTRPISGSRWVDYNQSMSKGLAQIVDTNKVCGCCCSFFTHLCLLYSAGTTLIP